MEVIPPNVLLVNPNMQNYNSVLKHIKNVRFVISKEIKPDYVMNSTCVVFSTVLHHIKHPKATIDKFEAIGSMYRVRIFLILVDDENNLAVMQEFNRLAFIYNYTLIFAFSSRECARYLETFKSYEAKPPSSIQAKEETEFLPRLHKLLANNIRSVNKTDVATLLDVFHNFSNVCSAKQEELILCPGIGETKAKRIYAVLHEPFIKDNLFANKKGFGEAKMNVTVYSEDIYKRSSDDPSVLPVPTNDPENTLLVKRSASDMATNDNELWKEKKLKSVGFSIEDQASSEPKKGTSFGRQIISSSSSAKTSENTIEIDP